MEHIETILQHYNIPHTPETVKRIRYYAHNLSKKYRLEGNSNEQMKREQKNLIFAGIVDAAASWDEDKRQKEGSTRKISLETWMYTHMKIKMHDAISSHLCHGIEEIMVLPMHRRYALNILGLSYLDAENTGVIVLYLSKDRIRDFNHKFLKYHSYDTRLHKGKNAAMARVEIQIRDGKLYIKSECQRFVTCTPILDEVMPDIETQLNRHSVEEEINQQRTEPEQTEESRNIHDNILAIMNNQDILPENHRLVLRYWFGLSGCDPIAPSAIAALLRLTPSRVHQMKDEALTILRDEILTRWGGDVQQEHAA